MGILHDEAVKLREAIGAAFNFGNPAAYVEEKTHEFHVAIADFLHGLESRIEHLENVVDHVVAHPGLSVPAIELPIVPAADSSTGIIAAPLETETKDPASAAAGADAGSVGAQSELGQPEKASDGSAQTGNESGGAAAPAPLETSGDQSKPEGSVAASSTEQGTSATDTTETTSAPSSITATETQTQPATDTAVSSLSAPAAGVSAASAS